MILIMGGAYQGKLTWARQTLGLAQEECFDCAAGALPERRYGCLYHMEQVSLRLAEAGEAPEEFVDRNAGLLENAAVICRDIGAGVVPMDAGERAWREWNGRLLRALADRADRVVRLFCGLPQTMKP